MVRLYAVLGTDSVFILTISGKYYVNVWRKKVIKKKEGIQKMLLNIIQFSIIWTKIFHI